MQALPHMTWADFSLQQGHVPYPELGMRMLLPDLMEAPQGRTICPLPPSP
jgi:hypothetical protein